MTVYPPDFCLLRNQQQRISAKQAEPIIPALLDGRLVVRYASVRGKERQWLELRADGAKGRYTIVFGFKDGAVQNLWLVLSPSVSVEGAKVYDIDKDGQVDLKLLSAQTLRCLSEKLVPADWQRFWSHRYEPKKPKPKKKAS